MKLTIPRIEHLNDDNIKAEATDFTKVLGVETLIQNKYYSGYVINDYNSNKQVTSIYDDNLELSFSPRSRFMGIRLVVNFSEISKYCSNLKINKDGHIYQANCFMYPKNVADIDLNKFENLYCEYLNDKNNAKLKTINSLTIDSYPIDSICPFFPKSQEQYMYNGKIYVRVLSNTIDKIKLSNNKIYNNNDFIWFESSPILWDIDQKNDTAMTHDIITGGIPFDSKDKYKGKFEKTTMNSYLNNYLKRDLINSVPYSKVGRQYRKTRIY